MTDKSFTQYSDYPADIAKALHRANAYWYMNRAKNTFTIKSRNPNAPLTEEEKHRICVYLEMMGFQMQVMFW